MPLPPDKFDQMIARIMDALPPSQYSIVSGSSGGTVDGYLRVTVGKPDSGMGEVGQNAIFYVTNGTLLPGDVLDNEYVAYDRVPSYGFSEAWKLIRVPPWNDMNTYTLNFTVENGWTTDPTTGNRVPTRSTTSVQAVLAPVRDPKLTDTLGVQIGEVALEGYCVSPQSLPAGVVQGTPADLTIDGVAGTFILGPALPDPMPAKNAAYGQYIVGRWTWQK